MGRKRKFAPNEDMLKAIERRKKAEAEFHEEMKVLQAAREARWSQVGQLAEAAGILNLADEELRAKFDSIAVQRGVSTAI